MKKWKIIIPTVIVVGGIIAATPALYGMFKNTKEQKAITAEYEAYLASNKTFFDNSYFNGLDVSGLTPDEALVKLEDDFESKEITIKCADDNDRDTFSYDRLSVDYKNLVTSILEAYDNQSLTRGEYVGTVSRKDYSYDITQDVDFDKTDLTNLECTDPLKRTESEDAYVSVDKVTGELSIVPEVYGDVVDEDLLQKKIETAVLNGDSEIILADADYIQPEVVSADEVLVEQERYYKTLLNKSLNVNVCGLTLTLTPSETVNLLDFEPDDEVDAEAVDAYILSLKSKYDTYESTRTFTTSVGETIQVVAGDYGWLIDGEGSADAITKALLSDNQEETVDCAYTVVGQRPATNEIGNTYVEINIRDQKIYMYVDGVQIVNDDVTTGMYGDPNCLTATGTYDLEYKTTNATLKGPTWDDFVYYWMPYDPANAVGMHDATWRTDEEFGGTNRYGNGSHGCVNCRLDTAGVIYNNIQMDTPIIVWE